MKSRVAYLDTSVVLRRILEGGATPEIEQAMDAADALITSRLALVESARAFIRLRLEGAASPARLADAEREVESVWARCDVWELTPQVCELAALVAPGTALRTLDALHAATFTLARRRIEGLVLLTVDERLRAAIVD